LGGKDNDPVDREAGDQFREVFPGIIDAARAGRAFLARAVTYLAGEAGVRQFMDIGIGLPTVDNTHHVAQRVGPESRIVYVDNDPLVLVHARALLTSTPGGVTDYIDADVQTGEDPGCCGADIGFTQPTALMLLGILGHVVDYDEARSIVNRLMDGLPSGSYLGLHDGTSTSAATIEAYRQYNESGAAPYILRTPEQIARFFDGLELLEPGLVSVPLWRPDVTSSGPLPRRTCSALWDGSRKSRPPKVRPSQPRATARPRHAKPSSGVPE
jgi:hypothetical protein